MDFEFELISTISLSKIVTVTLLVNTQETSISITDKIYHRVSYKPSKNLK